MFQDEAGFGRINKPKYCWGPKGDRPSVPCHHIREYRYAYGAVEPLTGDSSFLIMPNCNTVCMNIFLQELSKKYPDDMILLCCDGAAWHKAGSLCVPDNIELFFIPPYTPEMNPIEQIWKELRKMGWTCQEKCSRETPKVWNWMKFETERSVAEWSFKFRRLLMRPAPAAFCERPPAASRPDCSCRLEAGCSK